MKKTISILFVLLVQRAQRNGFLGSKSRGFAFWKLYRSEDGLWYWQEDGGSLLTARFMAIAEQKHKVLKVPKRVFEVLVYNRWLRSV